MKKEKWTKLRSEIPYSLYFMSMVTEATVFGFKKIFPESKIRQGVSYWEDGKCSYCFVFDELEKTVKELSLKSIKSPQYFFGLLMEAYKKSVLLNKYSIQFKNLDLCKLSSNELYKLIKKFSDIFYDFYSYGAATSLLGYHDNNTIFSSMNEIIRLKATDKKFSDYIVALSSSPKKLKTNLMEMEILRLAKKAKKQGIKNKNNLAKKFKKELETIKEKYEFFSFDFCDKIIWDFDHFLNLVMANIKKNIDKKIKDLLNYENYTKKKFEKISRDLKLSKSEIAICELVRNLGYYQCAREYEFQEAFYNLKRVQDEIGKRAGLTTLESKYLLPDEYKFLTKQPLKYKKITKNRIENSLCLVRVYNKTKVFIGKEIKNKFKKAKQLEQEKIEHTDGIKGVQAYPGKVTGIVKVIKTMVDSKKIRKGDILVSHATGPDLVTAMERAAAFVTDEGGITCHAAIVAREMKKPCVIGTKNATKVLKDGDLVEVDADKGIVKIIKK